MINSTSFTNVVLELITIKQFLYSRLLRVVLVTSNMFENL